MRGRISAEEVSTVGTYEEKVYTPYPFLEDLVNFRPLFSCVGILKDQGRDARLDGMNWLRAGNVV